MDETPHGDGAVSETTILSSPLPAGESTSGMKNQPLILYGSETGTAEDVAFKIFHLLSSSPSPPSPSSSLRISSIDDYDIASLPSEPFILFVISTTGDGEVPSAMKYFWRFLLQKNLPKSSLGGLSFGVFGLGDSGYDKYNAAARYRL